jgi:hypothetical protein
MRRAIHVVIMGALPTPVSPILFPRLDVEVMSTSATIRPINSLFFTSDRDGGEVPEWVRDELILSTPSCIAVGCYPEPDGPTTVTLGPS